MIATLTTDRILVAIFAVAFVTVRGMAHLARRPRRHRQAVRSAVSFRQPRPYDWEREA